MSYYAPRFGVSTLRIFEYHEINSYFRFNLWYFAYRGFQFAFKTRSEKMRWTNFCIFISTIVRYINFAQTLIMVVKRNAKIAIPVICNMKKKFLIAALHWNALAFCQIKKFLQTWQKMQILSCKLLYLLFLHNSSLL